MPSFNESSFFRTATARERDVNALFRHYPMNAKCGQRDDHRFDRIDDYRAGNIGENPQNRNQPVRVPKDRQHADAMRSFLRRIRKAPDCGTQGKITWTRDDLHQR
jgi:hypothetical protein